MFGKRKQIQELSPPPIATENSSAIELLRVWAAPGSPQQLSLRAIWKDPGAWGLLLADIANHAAKAYAKDGFSEEEVRAQIRSMFDAEWASPSNVPEDIS